MRQSIACLLVWVASSSLAHGQGVWTPLIYPGTNGGAQALGISGNKIVGQYHDTAGKQHGFLRSGGDWFSLDYPGALSTFPTGVEGDTIIGYYVDAAGAHGFRRDGTNWRQLPSNPLAVGTQSWVQGISGNTIVGMYHDSADTNHGFTFDGANWVSLSYPGVNHTYATGISGSSVVGYYWIPGQDFRGFLYDGADWRTLASPGVDVHPNGISGNSIVGTYYRDGKEQGFLNRGTTWVSLAYPGADSTTAWGVSGDQIVGWYRAGAYTNAYLLTIPEPGTLMLLLFPVFTRAKRSRR